MDTTNTVTDHPSLTKIDDLFLGIAPHIRGDHASNAVRFAPMQRDRSTGVIVLEGQHGKHATLSPLDEHASRFAVGLLDTREAKLDERATIESDSSESIAAMFAGWASSVLAAA